MPLHRLEVGIPFVAAILFYLTSPLIIEQVKRALKGEIAEGRAHVPRLHTESIPSI